MINLGFAYAHEIRDGGILSDSRNVVELSFLLAQQLKPAVYRGLLQLGNAKRHRPHEVVTRSSVPVPDFDQQPPTFVTLLQLAEEISVE